MHQDFPVSSPGWKFHPGKSWLRESWKELEKLLLRWEGSGTFSDRIPVNWSVWSVQWCCLLVTGAVTQVPKSHLFRFSLILECVPPSLRVSVVTLPGTVGGVPVSFQANLSFPVGSPQGSRLLSEGRRAQLSARASKRR